MGRICGLPGKRFSTKVARKLLGHSTFVLQMGVEGPLMLILPVTLWTSKISTFVNFTGT